jgi:DNA-binding MarR family transcriptional regulator
MNDSTPIDPTHLDVATRLRSAVARLSRQLNASASGRGLSPSQASVLAVIAFRGPITLSDLADYEGLNPTMVSRIVGKLDDAELIRRVPNPGDMRSISVEITALGRQVSHQIRDTRSQTVARCLSELPIELIDALVSALPALEQLAEGLIRERSEQVTDAT